MDSGFSTTAVASGDRVEFWREMVRRHFVPLNVEPLRRGDFDGSVRLRAIGELDVARVRANPMRAARTRRHVEHSASDEYFVGLHLRGRATTHQDGRCATLLPGDFALFDSARPYAIEFDDPDRFDHVIVRIPRTLLEARCRHLERATSIAVKVGGEPGRLVSPALRTLTSLDEVSDQFVEPMLDLLVRAIEAVAGLDAIPIRPRERTLRELKRFAASHHADADLSPARAARACFVSVRQVHRLFAEDHTTFGAFLRETRLRSCRMDLEDERMDSVPLAQIARRHGYRSSPVFTRAFTAQYGIGPRAFRQCGSTDRSWGRVDQAETGGDAATRGSEA